MKNYVQRNSQNIFEKSIIEISNSDEFSFIKLGLNLYIEQKKEIMKNQKEIIKRIESGNGYNWDDKLDKAKSDYENDLIELENLKKMYSDLEMHNSIKVNKLEVKYNK